jgi:Zn/Cd-binding protein ZinT
MNTINIKGQQFPTVKASKLESGMFYWDGSEIDAVVVGEKTVRFVLAGNVPRTVRASSLIALAHQQVAVML